MIAYNHDNCNAKIPLWNLSALFPPISIHTAVEPGHDRSAERKTVSPGNGRNFRRNVSKERTIMSNSNNNQLNIPQAREAMDQFKMQAAQDEDVSTTY